MRARTCLSCLLLLLLLAAPGLSAGPARAQGLTERELGPAAELPVRLAKHAEI